MFQRAAQVGHGQALVHRQALELVEHRRVGGVQLIRAEGPARAEHVHGQVPFQHGTDLHRRGVGAQHQVCFRRLHKERVLHLARRVVRLEVQGVEVEPLGFNFRAFGDLPAHAHEDVADPLLQRGKRMPGTGTTAARSRGDIHGFLDQDLRFPLGLQLRGAGSQRLVDASAGRANDLAGGGFVFFGQLADFSVGQAQRGLLADMGETGRLEFVQVGGGLESHHRLLDGGGDRRFIERLGTSCSWAGGVTSDMCCWDLGIG